ncbi:MAG: PAS domain S-box protein [Candidatus Acidiferrales bacterium]
MSEDDEQMLRKAEAGELDALRESEAHYWTIMENAPEAILILDVGKGTFVDCNEKARKLFRMSREELVHCGVADISAAIQPGGRPSKDGADEATQKVLNGDTPCTEWMYRNSRGEEFVAEVRLVRLPSLSRQLVRASIRDITERKCAERAQRESEELYRVVAETAIDAIITIDENSIMRFVNHSAENIFGYSAEEMLGREVTLLMPGSMRQLHRNGLHKYFETGIRARHSWAGLQLPGRHKSGREIPLEISFGEFQRDGRRGFAAIIRDVTERQRAEETLRESEARYRSLVDNATYGMYEATPDGELLYVNPALIRMLGYESSDDLLAVHHVEKLYRDPSERAKIVAQYTEKSRVDAMTEWKRKDGHVITVRMSGRVVRNPQASDCTEMIVEDITERLELEKQLAQAQKFEAIGQLAGGIAHDFNNMIGAILGWADLGVEETQEGSRLRRHFEKVRQQGDRAAALTRQLLAFARRQVLEPRNMDLNQSVTATLSLLERIIGSHVEIRTKLAPDLAVIRADPTQVEQVLMNLCINARDAMPGGGLLRIETDNAKFDETYCAVQRFAELGNYAMLSVTDTGSGMDAATLDRIFEPFFTTKELGKGSGLGLATVYGVVRQHGGFVNVYSELGLGTTFRIYLPVSSQNAPESVPLEDSGPVRGGSETILIAEDHDGLRELAREALSGLGYQVIVASDGEQAVREFKDHSDRIDMLLLDLILPKLTGPEVYDRIAVIAPDMPVIFMTGYSADLVLRNRLQQQSLSVIQKPCSSRDLGRRVREILDHRERSTRLK